jgi:hypothetical protein
MTTHRDTVSMHLPSEGGLALALDALLDKNVSKMINFNPSPSDGIYLHWRNASLS